jgi:lipopolysaccharide/colanic/teichoic acid biosynthesis glycosyltransferase
VRLFLFYPRIMKKSRFKTHSIILVIVLFSVLVFLCVGRVLAMINANEAHAPEPNSMVLIGSGLVGMLVRFACKKYQEFKRLFDIVVASDLLLIASPILLFAIILIKIVSKGPVIYRQERVGKNGSIFKIYKLRTMKLDAEKDTGPVWAKAKDPRLIKFGGILRKAHIDEIPQLFNVLKNEMSIIGPRPERPEFVRDLRTLIKDYEKRLIVNPGITGLAQIRHKYDETIEDVKKKIKYDLLYIRKMCWWVDLRILAQTFFVVLTGRGAR